jgi:general stress protein 26
MEKTAAISRAEGLAERSRFVMAGSIGDHGYPNVKAMFRLEHDGINRFFLSTNTSSARVAHYHRDSRACLYLVDSDAFEGLLLVGDMTVRTDAATKERLWESGWERYYSEGPADPDYCVLEFTARRGNYSCGLENLWFEIGGP